MKARHSSICAVALLVAAIALSGCSSKKLQPAFEPVYDDPYSFEAYLENRKKADRSSMSQEERFAYDNRTASLSTMRESGIPLPNLHLIEQAKTALGTPYVPGGTDTQGFDCSGFVQWAYRNVGVTLPRTAREQSVMGRPIKSGSMMAGDIVAFNHPRRGYHTGIYLGGGSFIHSPGRGKSVSIAALSDPYFSSTFIGARRVQSKESDAEAIKKLMALDSRKPTRTHKASLASSQKRSATRKQTSAAVAEHRTQADTQPLPPGNRRRLHKRQPKPHRKPSPRKRKPPGNRQPKPQIPKRVPYPQKTPRFRNRPRPKPHPPRRGRRARLHSPRPTPKRRLKTANPRSLHPIRRNPPQTRQHSPSPGKKQFRPRLAARRPRQPKRP